MRRLMKKLSVALLLFVAYMPMTQAKNTYVIGVEDLEYYPLWRYDESLGEYIGLGRKLLDAFAKSKGYNFEYRAYPIKRLIRNLLDNRIDFKFPDSPLSPLLPFHHAKIEYSSPAIEYIDGVFVKPENKGKGAVFIKTLGTVLGFTPWTWLDKIEAGEINYRETPNFEALINQAISGRIDGAYVNADVVYYHLITSGKKQSLVLDLDLPHVKGGYSMSTIKHPMLIKEFSQWLSENAAFRAELRKEFGLD